MRRMRSFFFGQAHLVLGYFLVTPLVASQALVAQNRGSNQAKASAAEEYSEEEETPNLETPKLGPDPQIDPKNEEKKSRDEKTAEKKAIAHQLIDDESQRAFPEWKIETLTDWTTLTLACQLRLLLAILGVISGILLANYAFYPPSIARIEYLASLQSRPPSVVYLSARTEEPHSSWWAWPFQERLLLVPILSLLLLVLFLLKILVTARFRRKRTRKSPHR